MGTNMNSWVTKIFDGSKRPPAKRKTRARTAKRSITTSNPYRAVTIHGRADCCAAAKRIKGDVFLAAHAPLLPLGGCTQTEKCHCRYQHLADRRQELRRDADFGLPGRAANHGERRCRAERRHQKQEQ